MRVWLVAGSLVLGAVAVAFPRLWVAAALVTVLATVISAGRARWIAGLAGTALVAVAFLRFARAVAPSHFDAPDIEKNALDHLREIYWAESQAHRFKLVDDAGQYLSLPELLGFGDSRVRDRPPLLKQELFGPTQSPRSVYVADGYCFVVWLPGKDGQPTDRAANADPVASSRSFAAYAWPADTTRGARRAFYIDEFEQICESDHAGFVGGEQIPEPSAYSLNATGGVSHCGRDDDDGPWHPWAQHHRDTPWSKEEVIEKRPRAER